LDCQKIGNLIYTLRKEKNMTQKEVAERLNLSDKTISKWERGLGCPDVSLLGEVAELLGINIEKMLSGEIESNELVGGNMRKIKFYVCPQCGNLMTATGEAEISCCGRKLNELEAVKAEEGHLLHIDTVEDELFLTTDHEMKKGHYIAFVAFVTGDKFFLTKQYPEWGMQLRIQKMGHGKLYYYCTSHGLFYQLL